MKDPQQLLHYRVLSQIGRGGQGTVYKALDTKLGRTLVLKVLPPELTAKAAGLSRFEREARLASSLDHPNICTIHDLHHEGGVHFIVMQYVEGRNVRQLVAGRPLALPVALSIAAQVADALAAAHARGIVHRDIKPGNVMVTDAGQVKVLDFGLAKLLDESAAHAEGIHHTQLTELGVPYGTAAAAAPEQAAGRKVDQRADIFSTGVLLYEMLTGTWPFRGQSSVEVRYAVMHATPKPVAEGRGEDSPEIARAQMILDRALAKEPEERYQSAGELRDDLRALLREVDPQASQAAHSTPVPLGRMGGAGLLARALRNRTAAFAAGGALLLLLAAAAYGLYGRLGRGPRAEIDSLAVLPFQNAGGDPEAEYLSDGITESLIDGLSQLPSVKVRSRNTAFRYKGRAADPRQVGRELGVAGVLTGRVEQRGDELVVNVELIDARDDTHVWGERYARRLSDLPRLQEEISRAVTGELRLRLSGEDERQLVKNYSTNADAYQLYLQGRYHWNKRTPEGLQEGIAYFSRAAERDPSYAPAYSGLADCYWLLNVYNVGPAADSVAKAREAARRALALDDKLAEAHASLASILYRYDWDWAGAERHFRRAVELKPDYATARQWYSAMLASAGRFDEANTEARRAHELEPFSLTIRSDLGRHLYYARRYEEALAAHRATLDLDGTYARAHAEIGYVLAQTGRAAEAAAEFRQSLALDGESVSGLAGLGYAYAAAGRREQAAELLVRLKEESGRRYVSPYHLAVIHAGLGDRAQALDHLEKAAEERFNWLVFLAVEPQFDLLRGDPRFATLVGRVRPTR